MVGRQPSRAAAIAAGAQSESRVGEVSGRSTQGGLGLTTLLTGGGTRGRAVLDDDVDLARDRVLVTRAQGGDRTAFDDLYMRYYRRLYRFCLRRLHDSHEAEDVSQEAFARAWRALPTFAGDRRFYPWLSVIASHLCTDVLRRRNRSTPVAEFHQSNVASIEDSGEELMVAAVDSELVAKAFTRLSDRHQRILHLREGSGWSYQRIADHEGVGITAVETLLWRARQALKREFASLAGVEGRTAAFIGGLFSLSTLRKLFSLPKSAARRMASTSAKGGAIAAGSAVAATAMVIGATLSAPTHSDLVTKDAGPTISQELAGLNGGPVSVASVPGSSSSGATDHSGSGSAGSILGTGVAPNLPTGGGASNPLQSTGTQLGNTVQGVTSGVGSLLNVLGGGTLSGQTVSGTSSLLSSASSTLSGTTSSGSTTTGSGTSGSSTSGTNLLGGTTSSTSNYLLNLTGSL